MRFEDATESGALLGPEPPEQAAPLAAVRRRLRRDPAASLAELARQLGMSTRTLQRTLEGAGTTLSMERDRLRGERASELLRDPGVKLDTVAAEIGCADRRSLNRLFRRVTGESPAEFRSRQRLANSGSPMAASMNAHTSARSA